MDSATGETVFALAMRAGAREVMLEGYTETERWRVPMRREAAGWVARILVHPGWLFYRFCVDGRSRSDRGAGKLRSADGSAWNFALISTARINRGERHCH